MRYFPAALERLTEQFAKLPGIGGKTAQRLAFHLLSLPQEEAEEFANAYFNYDLAKAQLMVDEQSKKWLSYEASNITEADLELLRMQDKGATVTVDDSDCFADSAIVTVTVNDFLLADSLGSKGRMVDEKTFTIRLVQDANGKWKVRMGGPLRSEK